MIFFKTSSSPERNAVENFSRRRVSTSEGNVHINFVPAQIVPLSRIKEFHENPNRIRIYVLTPSKLYFTVSKFIIYSTGRFIRAYYILLRYAHLQLL